MEEKDQEMSKFGVDETSHVDQERLEKMASQGCPECGSTITKHGSTLLCPNHGSKPFE